MRNFVILAFSLLSLLMSVSCARYDRDVRMALQCAGENRGELEKVLEHYSQDKADAQKLEAAMYLIGNMTYHRSYPAALYGRYCREVDSLFLCRDTSDAAVRKLEDISGRYVPDMIPVPDVRAVTADYLIWNIDYSFRQWETSPFLQHLDFSQFCEYVLPYKCVDYQPMSRWKEEYSGIGRGEMDAFRQFSELRHNAGKAVETSQSEIRDSLWFAWRSADCIPLLDFVPLCHLPFGTCIEYSVLGLLNSRSKGLPVSMDMIPSWPDRNGIHHWNNVLTEMRRNIDFVPFENNPWDSHYADKPLAKVYRYRFNPNKDFLEALRKEGRLYGNLNNIFLHDVTGEYCKTADVMLELGPASKGASYAYVCVFDNYVWTPVALSRIRRGKVNFRDLGVGVVYLPVVYMDGVQVPAGNPFLLDTRRRKVDIDIDHRHSIDMKLYRKYPAFSHIYHVRDNLHGGRIEAADNPAFKDARTMAEFPYDHFLANEVEIPDTTAFRFWRLVGTDAGPSDFAELYFYGRNGGKRVSGKIMSPDFPMQNPLYDNPSNLCDGDALTNFRTEGVMRWAGFDFGKPLSIGEVSYIRRGDGSDICPGCHYEFYYWDSGKWRLHGMQTAENVYLEFHDVPSGGLYLLKCPANGARQRIFIYENGEQVWY
ncbi:MAG: hypothetical protein K2J62_06865 [Bacteroidales bacterium]|nr:hypothetical protein [Bacteroidales bacterium]